MAHQFCVDNLIDQSDLSLVTGTEDWQFPLSNIKNYFTTKKFRLNGSEAKILIDTNSISPKDTIILVGSSVDGLGFTTASFRYSTTTTFAGAQIDLAVSAKHSVAYLQFPEVVERYFELTIGGSGSYVEASSIFLGKANELNESGLSATDFKIRYVELSDLESNRYGNRFVQKYSTLQEVSGTFTYIDTDERDLLEDLIVTKGLHTPFFLILDPNNIIGDDANFRYTGLFFFASIPEINSINGKIYSVPINLVRAG